MNRRQALTKAIQALASVPVLWWMGAKPAGCPIDPNQRLSFEQVGDPFMGLDLGKHKDSTLVVGWRAIGDGRFEPLFYARAV